MRVLPWMTIAFVFLGCGEGFLPVTYVDDLRVLAVRAEPPEIAWETEGLPPESRLSSLVADPAQLGDGGREVVVGYLSCTPDPASLAPSICSAVTTLRAPSELGRHLPADLCDEGEGGAGKENPFAFLGAERCLHEEGCSPLLLERDGLVIPLPPPTYRLEDDLGLGALPPGHPARSRGTQAVVLGFAVVATPEELVEGVDAADPCRLAASLMSRFLALFDSRPSVLTYKRIQVRGPDHRDEPNVNPRIAGILAHGVPLPAELETPVPEVASFRPDAHVLLSPRPAASPLDEEGRPIPDAARQRYTRYRQDGSVIGEEVEEWRYSWFSTAGRFAEPQTTEGFARWTTPAGEKEDPLPPGGRTFLYLVVRDGRGGTDWVQREVRVR